MSGHSKMKKGKKFSVLDFDPTDTRALCIPELRKTRESRKPEVRGAILARR